MTDLVKHKPKTTGHIRRVLVMVGYFRRYIQSFSKTADSLYQLLQKDGNTNTSSKSLNTTNDDYQEALNTLLLALVHWKTSRSILANPN